MDAITAGEPFLRRGGPAASPAQTAALAAIGVMVNTVAHEMRNLLGSLELYAAMLAERSGAASPEIARLSGRVLLGIKQLAALSADLLAVPRRPAIDPQPVDLRQLTHDSLEALRLAVESTGVVLRLRLPRDKAWIAGDAERLRQAILNLALNALQALGEAGTLTVTLRVRGAATTLTVRDTGHGMDRRTRARATEPFFSTRPNGTGLGLAVVREVADTHGARLAVASRPGVGTTVRLTFPMPDTCEPLVQETTDA